VTDLTALRPLVFTVAYGMLGSVTEAEDITQEALLRLDRDGIESPAAYAVTVTTRLAIDELRRARTRREVYVGSWLPEPLVSTADDPAVRVELADRLSMAFLVLLERLSPVERAVLLLREVFEYDYDRIADVVGKSATNCRQILTRARTHVRDERPRFPTTTAHRDTLAERFFDACEHGDLAALEAILAEDITMTGDGGGKAPALATPAVGRTRVARFLLGLFPQGLSGGYRVERVRVNGDPGAQIFTAAGDLIAVLSLHVDGDHIRHIFNVLNPAKLSHLPLLGRDPF
jgi:RNA polymerase sigma-70 factor (ECF subfamily)